MVVLWLKALGDNVYKHATSPLTAWVKIKAGASLVNDEEILKRYGRIVFKVVFLRLILVCVYMT